MEALLTYRGKRVTAEDAAFIRQLIDQEPGGFPLGLIEETVPGLGLAPVQRGFTRHGLPGVDVGPGSGRSYSSCPPGNEPRSILWSSARSQPL